MMRQFLFNILLLLLVSIVVAREEVETTETIVPLHAFTLKQPYIDENLKNKNFDMGGHTITEVNKYVRLTQELPSQVGWMWSRQLLTAASWVIEIEFSVSSTSHNGLFGDGFAFWFAKDKEVTGPVFGSKDYFTGLGIFFDTYANGRHRHAFPYVSAMLGDGKTEYDHENDGKSGQIGGCPADFRGWDDHPTKAKIKYIRGQMLQVQLAIKQDGLWRDCFLSRDPSIVNSLPSSGYIGFTSFTGEVMDNHDIIRVTVNAIVNPHTYSGDESGTAGTGTKSQKDDKKNKKKSTSSGGSGWIWIVLLLIVAGVVGFVLYRMQAANQRRQYKRF